VEQSTVSLIDKIVAESGKNKDEISEKVRVKQEKFAGLLTESGAALMVAKELGLELDKNAERIKIAKLEEGMSNIDLTARVMQVFSPKEFEKNGKKGKLCNMVIADDSGEIRLTLWHDDVKKMQEQGIEKGSVMELKNCYVTAFKEKPQLNLSYQGSFSANPQGADISFLPKIENKIFKLDELQPDLNDANVIARVLRIFPATEFKKEKGEGKVVNFMIGDKTTTIRATAWNDLAGEVEKLKENDVVKLEGAYTKQGMKGIELHLGYKARIVKNPKTEIELPSAAELRGIEIVKKKISSLHKEDGFVEIKGKITEIKQGKLFYNVCPQCGKKILKIDDGFLCEKCGEQKTAEQNAVISIRIEDESGSTSAVFYGKTAEELLGESAAELVQKVNEIGLDEQFEAIKKALIGKEIKLQGNLKENLYSSELEIIARNID
jgi:replication factor A1